MEIRKIQKSWVLSVGGYIYEKRIIDCTNYWGIYLLDTSNEVVTYIFFYRQKPCINEVEYEEYQVGFRTCSETKEN